MLVTDPDLGRLVNRNPNRHAYPHLGDLKSKADNASFFSSITTARKCANFCVGLEQVRQTKGLLNLRVFICFCNRLQII